MEQSLVILKPDAIKRGIIGEIITRFEKTGLKMVAAKLFWADKDLAGRHYPYDRKEFIEGMAKKTVENYEKFGLDVMKDFGTTDLNEIGQIIRTWLIDMITEGPVFCMVWEGPHAVELIRKMAGHTLPLAAAPGTIRGDYSFDSSYLANKAKRGIKNLLHASGTVEEARFEIPLWFDEKEIHSYERVEEKAMR
ncbi:nucleoside-diphosphate kinase [Candidatus Roizmanbacteria bacterium]|nr:nucleoside-diphosphate kinase [Candidatus Roizmanbacteria bacterium]